MALVEDGAAELDDLYQKVVHVEAKPHRRRQRKPNLKVLFEPKVGDLPQLRRDLHVEVPQMGTLNVPYAYKNGRLNLSHPEGFPVEEKAANNKANDLTASTSSSGNRMLDSSERKTSTPSPRKSVVKPTTEARSMDFSAC